MAELIQGYTRHNGRRKPEAIEPDSYSILHYQEAERISAELASLVQKSDELFRQLPAEQRDAYIQLVSHPLKASRAVYELNRAVAMNQLHGAQGRVSTNYWADQARFWFKQDAELTAQYHQLGDGRWNHMMSQPHLGFIYWRAPDANRMPTLATIEASAVAEMGVMAEGSASYWPATDYRGEQLALDSFYPQGQQQRKIEVFNRGTQAFPFTAKASTDWIQLSQTKGQIEVAETIQVSIDWSKVKTGLNIGEVHVQGTGWGGAKIKVSAMKPETEPTSGFVEADGYIALEAASAKVQGNNKHSWWQLIPGHGRGEASMAAMTELDYQIKDIRKAPYLEYPLYFHASGEFTLHSVIAPTLDLVPGRGLRFAVALNNDEPQIIDSLADKSPSVWNNAVLDGVRTIKSSIKVNKAGEHKLRIYLVDPALVLQKLMIDTGGLKPSYLGPEQSQKIVKKLPKT